MTRSKLATGLVLLALATHATAAPTLEEMWEIVQAQQAEIEALKQALDAASARTRVAEERLDLTTDYLETIETAATDRATSIGGYGELHYNHLDAEDSTGDVTEVDFHRFVMFFNHEFNDRVRFFSEVELEHAIAGDDQPGEVELEQAFVEMDLDERHYLRTGLFLVPVGMMNETHEPPTFYGVERNDVESIIIPSTWWEAGFDVGGRYANGLSWDFAVHSGLAMPTDGSSAFRVRSGRQKVGEALAEDLAYTLRLRYTGMPGLDLSASFQYQADPSQTGLDGLDDGILVNLNAVFQRGPFQMRGLWARWDFDGDAIRLADADRQTGWYVEPSYRFAVDGHRFGAYYRYEDVDAARTRDRFDQWEIGLNYYPAEDVVLKVDWRDRSHDEPGERGRDFRGFDLGMGYQF